MIKAIIKLKGGLERYNQEGKREIIVSTPGKNIEEILCESGIPLEQVNLIITNGALEKDIKRKLVDGDVVEVIPVIEGG